MKRHSESGLGLLAHLYQIRTPFFSTFQVFFKTVSAVFLAQTDSSNGFKFFFHIDPKTPKTMQVKPYFYLQRR